MTERLNHCAVIPAQAGIHQPGSAKWIDVVLMDPGLRRDDSALFCS
jgi:hypothetical protein